MDSTALPESEQKFHQLKMLGDAVTRARKQFEEQPCSDNALILQDAQQQYKKMRALIPLRIIQ